MKILFVLSLFVVSIYGQGLVQILKYNGFTVFAGFLESHPELLSRFTQTNDVTIWAPINSAEVPGSSNGRLRVRDPSPADISLMGSTTGPPPDPNVPSKRKRGAVPPLPPSNFVTLRTFLNDSQYVNLGSDQPGRVVSNYVGGAGVATLQVTSGTGDPVDQVSGPFKYDKGLIYGVTSYFTLPKPLFESLTTVGLTEFRDAIVAQGFKKKLSETPGVTIFAPRHCPDKIDISSHVITNGFLGFLPELYDQSARQNPIKTDSGIPIRVTLKDGVFYVNGVRIIRSNIIVQNGVVYEIEKPLY
ncbi:hypothetical protein FN846DRAFT_933461 [Sphaerosporella brunnea]|uniref:FAS1 domain-containing protein n=1 Tax=Sphaerosporella brunnea TaxID=1250544 RepID=A0A5J5F5Z7_9PEZI|nr:hypothetical protein FN846DRAFT_933461 [Sphaerosporella brunnea]